MLSIRSILVMPSQCSICRSLVNEGYSKHWVADTHLASELDIAYPALFSGVQQEQVENLLTLTPAMFSVL